MNAQICDYDMDFIILDLGSYVNILRRQTWESMGKPTLVWSLVQLHLSNQTKVFPIETILYFFRMRVRKVELNAASIFPLFMDFAATARRSLFIISKYPI